MSWVRRARHWNLRPALLWSLRLGALGVWVMVGFAALGQHLRREVTPVPLDRASRIHIRLMPRNAPAPGLAVLMEIEGPVVTGLTRLAVAPGAPLQLPQHVVVRDQQGLVRIANVKEGRITFARAARGTTLTVSYLIDGAPPTSPDLFATTVEAERVFATGYRLLALPDRESDYHVALDWDLHALPRAAAATSFAFGEHTTFAATSFDLAHSFYVTGDLHRRRTARGHRLIRRGYVPVFDPFEVLTTTEALVEVGTAMFEGPTEPRPTTVMLFTESRARPHFRGLAFPNSFALWFDPGRPISRRANLLIAHEVIHRWIGGTITVRDEEGRNAEWFDEGFAVFFARRLLHRAGRLSRDAMREEIARDLEGARRHADEDPRRPAPVGQARDHLTPAYHHGALYAEYLDRQLRDDGHTRGVLGLVRDLIGEAKPRRIRPTVVPVSELRRRLEGLLGAAGSNAFDAYAIHGDVPPL